MILAPAHPERQCMFRYFKSFFSTQSESPFANLPLNFHELLPFILQHNYKETIFLNKQFSAITREANKIRVMQLFDKYLETFTLSLHNKADAIENLKTIILYLNICLFSDNSLCKKQQKITILLIQIAEIMEYLTVEKIITFTLFKKFKLVSVDHHVAIFKEFEKQERRFVINKPFVAELKQQANDMLILAMNSMNEGFDDTLFDWSSKKVKLLEDAVLLAKENSSSFFTELWVTETQKEKDQLLKLLMICTSTIKDKMIALKNENDTNDALSLRP